MRKIARKINSTMFDVAAGPLYLMLFGIPLLVIAGVIILIVVTVKLIKHARNKHFESKENPEGVDSSVENK